MTQLRTPALVVAVACSFVVLVRPPIAWIGESRGLEHLAHCRTHNPEEVLSFVTHARDVLGARRVITLPRMIAKRHDDAPVRMHVMTCRHLVLSDFISTFSRFGVVFTDQVEDADVISRCRTECDEFTRRSGLCRDSVCRPTNHTDRLQLPPAFNAMNALRPLAREEGGLRQWDPSQLSGIGMKAVLCRVVNDVRQRTGFDIAPPCFDWPAERDQFRAHASQHPFWVYKPSLSSSGKGQMFLSAQDILDGKFKGDGLIQAYMHQPFLYDESKEPSGRRVKIKTDIRIYATMTSVEPLRVYLSKRGYFRSGHPGYNFSMEPVDGGNIDKLRHFVNNGPKIRAGVFEKACAYEHGFGSAGTLDKYWELLRREGVDPDFVWDNIVRMFEQLFAAHGREIAPYCSPRQDCHQRFVDFFADVLVLEDGQVRLLEIHPSCALKARQRSSRWTGGEMEGGFDPLVTAEARQATWSLKVLEMAHFIDPDFRHVVDYWLHTQRLLRGQGTRVPILTPEHHSLLITMAMELRLLCVLRMEPLFVVTEQRDERWRDSLRLSNSTLQMHALFDQYKLRDLAEWFGSGGRRCSEVFAWEL